MRALSQSTQRLMTPTRRKSTHGNGFADQKTVAAAGDKTDRRSDSKASAGSDNTDDNTGENDYDTIKNNRPRYLYPGSPRSPVVEHAIYVRPLTPKPKCTNPKLADGSGCGACRRASDGEEGGIKGAEKARGTIGMMPKEEERQEEEEEEDEKAKHLISCPRDDPVLAYSRPHAVAVVNAYGGLVLHSPKFGNDKKDNKKNKDQSFFGDTPIKIVKRPVEDEFVSVPKDLVVDTTGSSLLHYAAFDNNIAVLEELLGTEKPLMDLNAVNAEGETPLHLAVVTNALEATSMLLAKGASPVQPNAERQSPLMLAVMTNANVALVKEIVRYARGGLSLDQMSGVHNFVALHWACVNCNASMVDLLIRCGANRDARTSRGQTPLHKAAEYKAIDCMKRLLQQIDKDEESEPAKILLRDRDGYTALHIIACQETDEVETAKVLYDYATKHRYTKFIDATDIHKRSALHIAIVKLHARLARQLLEWGADQNKLLPEYRQALKSLLGQRTLADIIVEKFTDLLSIGLSLTCNGSNNGMGSGGSGGDCLSDEEEEEEVGGEDGVKSKPGGRTGEKNPKNLPASTSLASGDDDVSSNWDATASFAGEIEEEGSSRSSTITASASSPVNFLALGAETWRDFTKGLSATGRLHLEKQLSQARSATAEPPKMILKTDSDYDTSKVSDGDDESDYDDYDDDLVSDPPAQRLSSKTKKNGRDESFKPSPRKGARSTRKGLGDDGRWGRSSGGGGDDGGDGSMMEGGKPKGRKKSKRKKHHTALTGISTMLTFRQRKPGVESSHHNFMLSADLPPLSADDLLTNGGQR